MKMKPENPTKIQFQFLGKLQQKRANITFGQLFQISLKLRSDAGKSLRKPVARSAKFAHQVVPRTTAMYCDATVKGRKLPLILDSGAAGSIVSCALLNHLGILIDRPLTTMMINVNGERKRPLGKVLNLLITIKGITVPIDVVVVDANSYSAIVGNDWLSRVRVRIDYETCVMNMTWEDMEIEVPIEYRYMPHEKPEVKEPQSAETNMKG